MIEVRIEKDSVSPSGVRLTTYVLKYPRFCHSELLTHRVFSRNASSSRAIPLSRMIENIRKDPVFPIQFHKNKPGMQGTEPLSEDEEFKVRFFWEQALESSIKAVEAMNGVVPEGIHKQYVNRLLEPFSTISVVLTATDFDNFFGLRYHEDAQPEICELARQMYEAYTESTPKSLKDGEWHLPFIDENSTLSHEEKIYKSVASSARTSYNNHDGSSSTIEQDKKLYERLLGSMPMHSSPAEHQAMAVSDPNVKSGNFRGWIQYRQTLKGHTVEKFNKD